MGEKKKEEKIGEALLKVALGYQLAEVTEEYAEVDGALKLTKRKKIKKDVPPDLKAVQMLLGEGSGEGYLDWSEEELEQEKQRLLQQLHEEENKNRPKPAPEPKKTVRRKSVIKRKTEFNQNR